MRSTADTLAMLPQIEYVLLPLQEGTKMNDIEASRCLLGQTALLSIALNRSQRRQPQDY